MAPASTEVGANLTLKSNEHKERIMPYCPKCRFEYEMGIDICTDCDVDLVAELPPAIPEEYQDAEWIELYSFPGTLYAGMAIELLTREGIPAYSQSFFGGSAMGVSTSGDYVGALASVFVLEPDYDRGRDIIETMIGELPGHDEEGYEDEDEN